MELKEAFNIIVCATTHNLTVCNDCGKKCDVIKALNRIADELKLEHICKD